MDFWLLGGASVVLFLIACLGNLFRSNFIVEQKFLMAVPFFGLMALFCNNPHFFMSYKFGYTRGTSFLRQHWFSLVFVPAFLLCWFVFAYVYFDEDMYGISWIEKVNQVLNWTGLEFRLGKNISLGLELLSLSLWMMYLTVGWHYAKQIYGCMMVMGVYDKLNFTRREKVSIRWSLLIFAIYQFSYATATQELEADSRPKDPRFHGIQIAPLGLPPWVTMASAYLSTLMFALVVFILIRKYYLHKLRPSLNFMIAWISIYVWWIPFATIPEFYFLAVPFFHSLQYLPFAARMESQNIKIKSGARFGYSMQLLMITILGFLVMELIPHSLDVLLNTNFEKVGFFFTSCVVVFVNIHHYFIDSCVWRFDQPQVEKNLRLLVC